MDLRQPETWQRHQLAALERVQSDTRRFTEPVFSTMSVSSLVYLITWGALFIHGGAGDYPWLLVLSTALSAGVIGLTTPAFALAVSVESYFRRRLQAVRLQNESFNADSRPGAV